MCSSDNVATETMATGFNQAVENDAVVLIRECKLNIDGSVWHGKIHPADNSCSNPGSQSAKLAT